MPDLATSPLCRAAALRLALGCTVITAALAGCGGSVPTAVLGQEEDFDSTVNHTRLFAATSAQTCEAARRALLSQGYVISAASAELVNGRKYFQPGSEVHVEVEFRVVCAQEGVRGEKTTVFASALQDRYALKKSNNSASVGVGVLGSLSVPFSSSDDALVKVASETLSGARFYDRFFRLMERYLPKGEAAPPDEPASAASAAS